MKRNEYRKINYDKYRAQQWLNEHKAGGFRCSHCRNFVVINEMMGTANRNHCNWCLWSKHVDEAKGDRRSDCNGGMLPIGLTFKFEGRYKLGEIMLIHICSSCRKISINRIARDDPEHTILQLFRQSWGMNEFNRSLIAKTDIYLASKDDEKIVQLQLFGRQDY